MIVTSRCGILESYRDTVPLAPISFLPSPILESKEKEKKERTRNPERALRRAIRYDDSRSIEVDKISIGGTEVFVPKKKKKRMEDPRKPVVNTVTIRLDVRETDGGNKSGRDEGEVRKMEKEEGRGRKSGGRRSHVFLRSRSTWFVRASMWANNAHFGSNRDALHSVHYSVHVSMWPGRGRGYTLPPSSSVANNIA